MQASKRLAARIAAALGRSTSATTQGRRHPAMHFSKARASALILTTSVALAVGAGSASAFEDTYCGQLTTPAHGSCWYSTGHPSGNHSWTSNHATYGGPMPFQNCAAIGYFPKNTIVSTCPTNNRDVFIAYCGSPTTPNKDAGVGNSDGYNKTIQGRALTGGC